MMATICSLERPVDRRVLERDLLAELAAMTPPALAALVEEPSENDFPSLPVRTDEPVVVWIQRVDARAHESSRRAESLLPGLVADPVRLRLAPTTRSRLR
jgi:hypothetical protein